MKAIDKINKGPWLWLGLGLALVVALGGAGVATGLVNVPGSATAAQAKVKTGDSAEPDKAAVKLEFAPREVVQPQMARMPGSVEFSGPLVAPQTALVRAKAGGALLSLNVTEGSRVQAGQLLGRIEMAEMDGRLAERGALIESARASLAQAERSHTNNERLAQQQFISPTALDMSRSTLDGARAQLAAAQAALATARAGLRDGSLVAPIAGIVAKRHVLPGERLSPEQQVLSIVDLRQLELAGTVGTHEVSRLSAGMPVQVTVEGLPESVPGRIARIAPSAEPGTRAIGVTIALVNPKEALRAGQYAMVRAVLADDTERLTLPDAAVTNTSGQDHVWVIDGGVLARRAVMLGRRDAAAGRVEVLQGVQPDSVVLAARFENLREGAKALVVSGRPVAAAVAAASASSAGN
jgi:RND family efflux transporter MFP subunit